MAEVGTTPAQRRVSAFWAESHWRNGYKATAPGAHSGQDIGGWPAGTMIPALRGGVVTHNFYDAYYGWCLSVQISKSTWDIYCHMKVQSPQKVGYSIEFGEGVGQVGNTGAFSAGNHLHLTISSSWKPAYRPTTDPKAAIKVALKRATTPAGGAGTPLIEQESEMYIAVNTDNTNPLTRRLLVTSVSANVITEAQSKLYVRLGVPFASFSRDEWLVLFNDGVARVNQLKGAVELTPEQVSQISAGVKVDLNPVLTAVEAVRQAVLAVPAAVRELFRTDPLK